MALFVRYSPVLLGSGGGGGVSTVGTIDSQTPAANGAVIVGSQLFMQSGSATVPGLVNNTTQSFTGNKTFSGANTFGASTVLTQTISGSAARGKQLQFGTSSAFSTIGARASGANLYLAYNAYQTADNTDSWAQSLNSDSSTKLNIDDSGVSLYNANLGTATGNNSTFWGSAVWSVSSAGDMHLSGYELGNGLQLFDRINDTISVKDYGATGDGVTDDTTAIQNAVNAAGPLANKLVFFPPGLYLVTGTITMHYGVALQGTPSGTDSNGGTCIYHASNSNLFVWDGNNVAGNSTGGGCRDMQLLKKDTFSGGDAIYLVATSGTKRPGEMVFMNIQIFGESHSPGGLWGRGVHIDGTAANTAGSRGVRSTYWIKVRVADFTTNNQAWYFNQATHVYGDVIVDPGDATGTDGVTFDGFWDNVSLRFRSGSAVIVNHTGTPGTDFANLTLTGSVGTLAINYASVVGTATLALATNNGVTNTAKTFMVLANDADMNFGSQYDTTRSMYFDRNGTVVGGVSTANSKMSMFGGATPASHISVDSSGNTAITGTTTLGGAAILGPVIAGSAARGRQIQVGDSSTYSTLGVRFSGANLFLAYNAKQTTENTDSWTQVNAGDNSTKLSLDDSGISLYNAAAASSPATNASFWGASVFSVSQAGVLTASNFSGTTSGTNTGDVTLAAFGSTPATSGASLSGQVLTLQPADGTHGGGVSTGAQTFAGAKTFSAAPILSTTSASQAVFTDASKNLVSNAITGSGNVVMSASPTLTGTIAAANETLSGTLGVTGVATFTAQPIVSSLSVSQAVFTDGSKGLVSNAITGSGNVVMSTSPTLVTPALGTPSALVGTNISGTASGLTAGNVTTNANLTGPITSVGNATSIASQTGTGTQFVMSVGPTIQDPVLTSSISGVSRSTASGNTLAVANGATQTYAIGAINAALVVVSNNTDGTAALFIVYQGGGIAIVSNPSAQFVVSGSTVNIIVTYSGSTLSIKNNLASGSRTIAVLVLQAA